MQNSERPEEAVMSVDYMFVRAQSFKKVGSREEEYLYLKVWTKGLDWRHFASSQSSKSTASA